MTTRRKLTFAAVALLVCGVVVALAMWPSPGLVLTLKGIETNQAVIATSDIAEVFGTNHFVAIVSVLVSNTMAHDVLVSCNMGGSKWVAASQSEMFQAYFSEQRPWHVSVVECSRVIYAGKNRLKIAVRDYAERFVGRQSAREYTLDIP